MVTPSGEQHGFLENLPNAVPFDDYKNYEPSKREEMKKKHKNDAKIVRARFINHQYKDEAIPKVYCRPGQPLQKWLFIPGYEYSVPLGLVEEVNQSRQNLRAGLQSIDGKDVNKNGSPVEKDKVEPLYELVPLSFG